jgi:hypothetical protein
VPYIKKKEVKNMIDLYIIQGGEPFKTPFSLDEIISYGFDGQLYYMEVSEPLYGGTEMLVITQDSFMRLTDAMEEKHR